MEFLCKEVLGSCNTVNSSHTSDWALSHMNSHCNTIFLCKVTDFLILKDSTGSKDIRMDHRYTAFFQKRSEVFFQINILACTDRYCTGISQAYILVCQLPRNQILHPCDVIFFNSSCQLDAGFHSNMSKMVNCKWNIISDNASYIFYILLQDIKAMLCYLNACKWMWNIVHIIVTVAKICFFLV